MRSMPSIALTLRILFDRLGRRIEPSGCLTSPRRGIEIGMAGFAYDVGYGSIGTHFRDGLKWCKSRLFFGQVAGASPRDVVGEALDLTAIRAVHK